QIPVDIRVVAATNQNLDDAVRAGRIREDFYYRINVMPLRVPPLRERLEDIPLLVVHFLQNHPLAKQKGIQGLSDEAIGQLSAYHGPGNIRERRKVLEGAVLRRRGDMTREVAVGAPRPARPPVANSEASPFDAPLKEFVRGAEREYLSR